MKYQELRSLVQNWPKHEGCVKIDRSPLINDGFPGTFNLSFTEDPWLREYGRLVDFDHDYTFSTVQSCIRPQDVPLTGTKGSWKYLGIFEIADIMGMVSLAKKPDYQVAHTAQIKSLIDFLSKAGINPKTVYPSYNLGGKIAEITQGKYLFDFNVPEDKISKEGFMAAGVPENNLREDRTRNTFLSLHFGQPSPWGYRNEVNVNVGTEDRPVLLDVATLGYLLWVPSYKGEDASYSRNIVGLRYLKNSSVINAVGLERLCLVVNGLRRVQDVDYIVPFYDCMRSQLGEEDLLAGESLRALHRVHSDIASYGCQPGRHQKAKIRALAKNIPPTFDAAKIKELLGIHTQTQPWHPNLQAGIEPTIERIERYRKNK